MKEAIMKKETTLKVKNQITTLQKVTIICDVLFMVLYFSTFLCNLLISYIIYRMEGKEGARKWEIVLLIFLFLTAGPVNSLMGLGNASLLKTFLPKNKVSEKEEEEVAHDEPTVNDSSVVQNEAKKTDPKKDVDLWLNHFAYQTINRFIMEADACGCEFLQVNTSGKVEGYGEENGELKKMYEDMIDRLPDSKFFPYVCSEFERLWREVSTDYSDDKFVIQWK